MSTNLHFPVESNVPRTLRERLFCTLRGPFLATFTVPLLLVLLGTGLRLERYLSDRSLWSDEAKLALNVLEYSPYRLIITPLQHRQVAPAGFLLAEKLTVAVLGPSEWALRLFPLLCGIAALLLFWRLLHDLEASLVAMCAGLLLFACSPYLVHFSSDTKQYSVDVAVSVLVMLFTVRLLNRIDRRAFVELGIVGGCAAWFSPAVGFVLLGASAALAILAFERRARPKDLAVAPFLWGVVGIPALLLYVRAGAPHYDFMVRYWSQGFLPLPPTSGSDLVAYFGAVKELFVHPMGLARLPEIGAIAFLAGLALMAKTNRPLLALVLCPVAALLLASGLRLYPLGGDHSPISGRLVLFLLPILILTSVWASQIRLPTPPRLWALAAIGVTLVMFLDTAFQLAAYRRMYRMDSRAAAAFIAENRQPGDVLYAVDLIWPALRYYSYSRDLDVGDVTRLDGGVPDPIPSNRTWVVHYPFENHLAVRVLSAINRPFDTFEMSGVYVHRVRLSSGD